MSFTVTSVCDELNWSTSFCSVSWLARVIECHMVISIGLPLADFSAFNGHDVLFAAPAPGTATIAVSAEVTSTAAKAVAIHRRVDLMSRSDAAVVVLDRGGGVLRRGREGVLR